MTPSRPRGPHSRELNHVLPSDALPLRPHVGSIATSRLRTWAYFIQSCGSSASRLPHVGNPALSPIAGLDRCRDSSRSSRNSLRSELAGDPAQDEAESLGSIASIISPVRHGPHIGAAHVANPGKLFTFEGNEDECRR